MFPITYGCTSVSLGVLNEDVCAALTELARGGGGGGGRRGTQQSLIRGGSDPRSKPLPLYIPFLIEKVPLSYTFHRKLYAFHIPTE